MTAARDTEGAAAQPLMRTCARWRCPTPRVRRRDPSGGHARDGGGRPEGAPARSLRRTRTLRRRPTATARWRDLSGGNARDSGARFREAPVRPLMRTRVRRRHTTPTACRHGPAGGHACDGCARPRVRAGAAREADTSATAAPDIEGASERLRSRPDAQRQRATSRSRQRDPLGGHAHDDSARPRRCASVASQVETRAIAAPDREACHRGSQTDTRVTEARTPRAPQRGPSGGHARDGAARPQRPASAAPKRKMRATVAPDSEGTPVWPLRRIRARRRRPTRWRASVASQSNKRATVAPDAEGAPARPLRRTRTRQRRPTPRSRQRSPSGEHACDSSARPR